MIKINPGLIAALLAVWAMPVFAQDNAPERKPEDKRAEADSDWEYRLKRNGEGIDREEIGFNFFTGPDADGYTTTADGLGSIKLNLLRQYRFYAGTAYIAPGLGLAISEFRFEDNLYFQYDEDAGVLNTIDDMDSTRDYGKSKLQLGYARIPVEIGIQARKFNLALGAYGDLLLWSKHKRKFMNETRDENVRTIHSGIEELQLERFQFGVYGRVAVGSVGLYVNYNLTNTFQSSGPDMTAVQVGVAFSSPFEKKNKKGLLKNLPLPKTKKI